MTSQAPAKGSSLSKPDIEALKHALDAYDQGLLDAAKPALQSLAGKYPHNFEIIESLGSIYAEQSDFGHALPYLKSAVSLYPNSSVGHANLGTAYLKLGQQEAAVRELELAARLDPSNSETQVALGQSWMALHQPEKAAAAFSAALNTNANDSDLFYNYALAQFDSGKIAEAATLLSRMPGENTSAPAESLYADVEEKLGNYKEAAGHYVRAAQLAPTEPNIYLLGLDFLRHWTLPAAVTNFEAGIKQFPESRRMKLGLGIAYYGNGNYDQAIPVFADLLKADPENTTYAGLLGRTCTVLTEGVDPRCSAVIQFAEDHPRNAVLCTYAANSILHRPSDASQLEIAGTLLESAIKADPSSAEAHYAMGVLLQMKSKWPDSIPELQKAITIQNDFAQAHYRLALAYSHIGRKDEANKEIALQQEYSDRERKNLDARMKNVTTLLVSMQ